MPLNFPSSPTEGQIYTNSESGISYSYNSASQYWSSLSANVFGTSLTTQILFNDGGSANGSNGLTFSKSSNTMTANSVTVSSNVVVFGSAAKIEANGLVVLLGNVSML